MPKSIPSERGAAAGWPFHAALATRSDARFAIATVHWSLPSAPARSTLLTADTVEEAAVVLAAIARRLRGRSVHGPLRGGDPANLLTAWTAVPVPPALRGATRFPDLLAAGPLERRIAAATLLQQREDTTIRFVVEGMAEAFAVLADVAPPTFRRTRAHGSAARGRVAERRP